MKFLITGASGFVGSQICQLLLAQGHTINALTRDKNRSGRKYPKVNWFAWDAQNQLPPADCFEGVQVVLNLVGENIAAKRWSAQQKQKILNSRKQATANLVAAIKEYGLRVEVLVSSSAVGIYPANNEGLEIDEQTQSAQNFLADVCTQWEQATAELPSHIRKVILRIGVVFGAQGGALARLAPLFKLGLGGPIGSGQAWMPWIHIEDLARLFIEAATNTKYQGVFNAVSPAPVRNQDFTRALARSLKRPAFFPVPPLALKLAFGEMSSIILDSQKVRSKRLEEVGFKFKFPQIQLAMDDQFGSEL